MDASGAPPRKVSWASVGTAVLGGFGLGVLLYRLVWLGFSWSWSGGRSTALTVFVCGARRFSVSTWGHGVEGVHARVLASVRCHPDLAQEGKVDALPVVLQVRR